MSLSALPVEIISEIFSVLKPPEESPLQIDADEYPLLFGRVCSKWRMIAHSTPGLWTGIRLTLNQCTARRDGVARIREWVARARGNPLSITIFSRPASTSVKEANEFVRSISPVLVNVRHMCLVLPLQHMEALNAVPQAAFRDLETFKLYLFLHQPGVEDLSETRPRGLPVPLGLAHNLHSVQLISSFSIFSGLHRGIVMHGLAEAMPWHQLRRLRLTESTADEALVCSIFRQCTRLEECLIEITDWAAPPRAGNTNHVPAPTSLAHLRTLKWHFPQFPPAVLTALALPALPALDSLEIRIREADPVPARCAILLALQSRAPLPLTALALSNVVFGPGQLLSALTGLPTLESLHLTRCHFFASPAITFCLTHRPGGQGGGSAPPFLPRLQSLRVRDPALGASINDDQLLDMLESRWSAAGGPLVGVARLQVVAIDEYVDDEVGVLMQLDLKPSERSFARSEALVRAGMELTFPRMRRGSWRFGVQWDVDSDASNEE